MNKTFCGCRNKTNLKPCKNRVVPGTHCSMHTVKCLDPKWAARATQLDKAPDTTKDLSRTYKLIPMDSIKAARIKKIVDYQIAAQATNGNGRVARPHAFTVDRWAVQSSYPAYTGYDEGPSMLRRASKVCWDGTCWLGSKIVDVALPAGRVAGTKMIDVALPAGRVAGTKQGRLARQGQQAQRAQRVAQQGRLARQGQQGRLAQQARRAPQQEDGNNDWYDAEEPEETEEDEFHQAQEFSQEQKAQKQRLKQSWLKTFAEMEDMPQEERNIIQNKEWDDDYDDYVEEEERNIIQNKKWDDDYYQRNQAQQASRNQAQQALQSIQRDKRMKNYETEVNVLIKKSEQNKAQWAHKIAAEKLRLSANTPIELSEQVKAQIQQNLKKYKQNMQNKPVQDWMAQNVRPIQQSPGAPSAPYEETRQDRKYKQAAGIIAKAEHQLLKRVNQERRAEFKARKEQAQAQAKLAMKPIKTARPLTLEQKKAQIDKIPERKAPDWTNNTTIIHKGKEFVLGTKEYTQAKKEIAEAEEKKNPVPRPQMKWPTGTWNFQSGELVPQGAKKIPPPVAKRNKNA